MTGRTRWVAAAGAGALVVAMLTAAPAVGAEGVVLRDLGTLGGSQAEAVAVNDAGMVVGWSHTDSGEEHAFAWTTGGGIRDLGPGRAVDVNASGQVLVNGGGRVRLWSGAAGSRDLGEGDGVDLNDAGQVAFNLGDRAFRWDPVEGPRDLGVIPCQTDWGWYCDPAGVIATTHAMAMNSTGQITGYSGLYWPAVVFVWDERAGITAIEGGSGVDENGADENGHGTIQAVYSADINDAGEVAAYVYDDGWWSDSAFVWSPIGGTRWIADVESGPAMATYGPAIDLNNRGQVLVNAQDWGDGPQDRAAIVDSRSGSMAVRLGVGSSWGVAMNDRGEVVGSTSTTWPAETTSDGAFVWQPGVGPRGLPGLGGEYSSGVALSETGLAVGWAMTAGGDRHAVLWDFEPGAPTSVEVVASADTYVNATMPLSWFGTKKSLESDGSPVARSYLRFVVPQQPGMVLTGASLRLRTTEIASAGSSGTHAISIAANTLKGTSTTWLEGNLRWANAPVVTGPVLGRLPAGARPATSYTVAMDAAALRAALDAAPGGQVTLAVSTSGGDSLWFRSRDAASKQPTLTLTYSPAP